jgi:hypothetical protein
MSVNLPAIPPRDLYGQATAVLTMLHLPTDIPALRQRVETFILCNGFHGVYAAARSTARLFTSDHPEVIHDPWPYTIRIFNRNLARSSYLYSLRHWVESGLRSQLDLHYTKQLGTTWHRRPSAYIERRQVPRFQMDYDQQLGWQDQSNTPEKLIVDPVEPVLFLQRLSLRWLTNVVLHVHKQNNRTILVRADQRTTDPRRVAALLDAAVGIRNAVAHNHPISNEVFTKTEQQLLELL